MSRILVVFRRAWLALLIVFLLAGSVHAAPALPGDRCQVEPRPVWSETETWVWNQICVGEIADLNVRFGRDLDPRLRVGWTDERNLSFAFLETVLLYDPWRSAVPRQGVRIAGAWFPEQVNLEGAEISQKLWLAESRFVFGVNLRGIRTASAIALVGSFVTGELDLSESRVKGQVELSGTKIAGAVYADEANIGRSLFMHSGDPSEGRRTELWRVFLRGASIHGQVSLVGIKITGTLQMDGAEIGEGLLMYSTVAEQPTELQDVNMHGAKVGGQVALSGAKLSGALNMNSAVLSQDLLMYSSAEQRTEFQDVIFVGTRVGGQVALSGAKVAGTLDMNSANFGQDLSMESGPEHRTELEDVAMLGVKVGGQVNLIGAKVRGTLYMDDIDIGENLLMHSGPKQRAEFQDVNLGGAMIGGQLSLVGAEIGGRLDMDSAVIGQSLLMSSTPKQRAEFTEVYLDRAKVSGQINLTGARITGQLSMDATVVGQILLMGRSPEQRAEFQDVDLSGARIGGQISLVGAVVSGRLALEAAVIDGSLFMNGDGRVFEERPRFDDVILRDAKIGGHINLTGAKVAGMLDMHSADIGGSLWMRSLPDRRAEFGRVILVGASIGGQLDLTGAKIAGVLDMDATRVGISVFMRDDPQQPAEFNGAVNLVFARIGGNLDLRGAALSSVDLTGTVIGGELRLASPRGLPTWAKGGRFNLRNVTVDALQDEPGAWPSELDLDGLTYGRLGGFDMNPHVDVAARGSEWFVDWLARDQPFTPQPYEQLAGVLRQMGHDEEANDVLFAARERGRERAWEDGHWHSWIGQTLLKSTVGYGLGYRYFWALYWVVGLILIGTIWLGITGENQRKDGTTIGVWYSLDVLLPIIQLRHAHYDIDLEGSARYYFYFHKFMGYVLASFLIAGLAGLTK